MSVLSHSPRRGGRRALVACVALVAVLAAACGGGSGGSDGGSSAEADPAGVLRLGTDFSVAGRQELDIIKITSPNLTAPMHEQIYGTLLKLNGKGEVVPDLAKSVDIVDPSHLKVVLKDGLKFTDGTPLDAEALKFSWERTKTQAKPGISEIEFASFSELKVVSPTQLDVTLSKPQAGAFYRLLRLGESMPVSPTAVKNGTDFSQKPVGAGPFMVDSIVPGELVKLVKSPTYWNAANVKLAGIEYKNVTAQAVTNAVRSNTVDFAVLLDTASVAQVKGTPNFDVTVAAYNGGMVEGLWCKKRPPFDDIKVRQALNYAIDRDELNLAVADGLSEPTWGFNNSKSQFYDPALKDFYKYNPDKAKALLAEAGKTNLSFTSFFQPASAGQKAAEVIQQQLAKIGVTMTLKPLSAPSEFYPEALGAPINILPLPRVGIQQVTRVLVPGSIGNICTWDDPVLNALVDQIQGIDERSPEGVALWKKISRNGLENASNLFGIFGVQGTAINTSRLGNVELYETRSGFQNLDVETVFIKK